MFDNIEEKIKGLAILEMALFFIALIVGFIMLFIEDLTIIGGIVMGSSLSLLISAFFTYGFGELIDTTLDIHSMLTAKEELDGKNSVYTFLEEKKKQENSNNENNE